MKQTLKGIRVVNLAINLPGPVAAARLSQFGANVVKIEPPAGDPLALACRAYYERLTAGQEVVVLDLKRPEPRSRLDDYLTASDLLLTAQRPAALERLGLAWPDLHQRFPNLCHAALLGFAPPSDDFPGHDLMFQAASGLLDPPHMPRALVADLGAAEQLVSTALALLLARARTGASGYAQVSIDEAAAWFALPTRHGVTVDGPLSGALPTYAIYRAREGYVAFAALEAHFLKRFTEALGLPQITRESLETLFLTRPAHEWDSWARKHNIPLVAVTAPGDPAFAL